MTTSMTRSSESLRIGFCTVYLDILSVRFGQCSCIGPGLAAAVGWVQRLSQ
jgi:hypothetical protein